ncbi:MAG: endonuclease/exonuclease/phosphatase family protein [Bacteroidota bacterium]|jgi:predicted extracellular nuclease
MVRGTTRFSVILTLLFVVLVGFSACGSLGGGKGKSAVEQHAYSANAGFRVAFYNLENLFDTVDGPNDDAEFLPASENRWNTERYQSKLKNMAKVIDSIAPDILGVVEVENAFVLEDLRKHCHSMHVSQTVAVENEDRKPLGSDFEIVHRESPDARGIDVALIYNRQKFYATGVYMTSVALADGYKTRDIMRVHLVERLTGDSLAIFVNHWPSRRGGAASAASRMAAAAALTQTLQNNPSIPANYLLMGDFNDDPEDPSITEGLQAGDAFHSIVNLAFTARAADSTIGTLAWHTGWNMFDQIMVSRPLYYANLHRHESDGNASQIASAMPNINVYKRVWMLQHDGNKYDGWPLRTFAGKKYMNGFSDHLPVYTDIVLVHRH